jgi:hypothetical protein
LHAPFSPPRPLVCSGASILDLQRGHAGGPLKLNRLPCLIVPQIADSKAKNSGRCALIFIEND